MKRFAFFMVVCLGLIVMSCTGFKSRTWKISEELSAFTQLGENGDTLIGVKNKDGKEILPPKADVRYTVDKKNGIIVFEINKKDGATHFYTPKGVALSSQPLTGLKILDGPMSSVDETAYIAKDGAGEYYGFFVSTGHVFECDAYTSENSCGYIGMAQGKEFSIYTLKGDLIWKVGADSFYWVYEPFPASPKIVVPDKSSVAIHKLTGEKVKNLSLKEWNKKIKGKDVKKVGPAQVITVGEEL